MSIPIIRKYMLRSNILLSCEAGGKQEQPAFIGTFVCGRQAMPVFPLVGMFEARFPDPNTLCGGGDRSVHPQCAVRAPGASHPGVIMVDQYLYTTKIDMVL